jgi:hypothetical protein
MCVSNNARLVVVLMLGLGQYPKEWLCRVPHTAVSGRGNLWALGCNLDGYGRVGRIKRRVAAGEWAANVEHSWRRLYHTACDLGLFRIHLSEYI